MSVIYGTNWANNLNGSSGADRIYGWDRANAPGDFGPEDDNDRLFGGLGDDLLSGGAGDDYLDDFSGVNTLYGGAGDDRLAAGFGAGARVDGGAGVDQLTIGAFPGAVPLNISFAGPEVEQVLMGTLRVLGVERLAMFGSALDDMVTGGGFDDVLYGQLGDDVLAGAGGNDYLEGDMGLDSLFGGEGNDTLSHTLNAGAGVIEGGAGTDLLRISRSGAGNEVLVLQDSFTLADGTQVTGMERLEYQGSSGSERVTGGALDDLISCRDGADLLEGMAGNDYLSIINFSVIGDNSTLYGGRGDDTIEASGPLSAGEQLWGGLGIDLVRMSVSQASGGLVLSLDGAPQTVVLPGGATIGGFERMSLFATRFDDRITGGRYDDTLYGSDGADLLNGGGGLDSLEGQTGNDTLNGGAGNDILSDSDGVNVLNGGDGSDFISSFSGEGQVLSGGAGNDWVEGGFGDDQISGGLGRDLLIGGGGADRFVFNVVPRRGEADQISDFAHGVDKIQLALAGFAGLTAGGVLEGQFAAGTAALDAGDRILYDAATGLVRYDADGLGGVAAVLVVTVGASAGLTFADFTVV